VTNCQRNCATAIHNQGWTPNLDQGFRRS
jgi:hypothetical protein